MAHDWGAGISWQLAIDHPERVDRYVALSTGHPMAYRSGGLAQKLKGYYTMMFQLPWLPEWLLSGFNWFGLRLLTGFPEEHSQWISQQSRPGRLRAGLTIIGPTQACLSAATAPMPGCGCWACGVAAIASSPRADA